MKLLVIDDDPIHHTIVGLLLQKVSPPVKHHAFLDASDAFYYILKNNTLNSLPDLILLDLDMPLVSGWGFLELLETISDSLDKKTDVIILTSSIDANIRKKAAKYNCVKGVFSKPLSEEMLSDILSSAFISMNRSPKH